MGRYFLSATLFATFYFLASSTCQFHNGLWAQTQHTQPEMVRALSLNDAIEMMYTNNYLIQQADKGIEIALAEKQRLNSTWYPFIAAGGSLLHMSNDIEAKEDIGELIGPFKEALPELGALAEQILPVLGKYGLSSLTFPLLDNNIATIDGSITWPLFTGGKRVYANRIGKSAIASAQLLHTAAGDNQTLLVIEKYYMAKLSKEIVDVQMQNLAAMEKLYSNALKLMNTGIINKAGMLSAKVAWQEASRELENAKNNDSTATEALKSAIWKESYEDIGYDSGVELNYTTPFFMCSNIPSREYFKNSIDENNPQLHLIESRKEIAENKFKIARSGYMPDIALFGKQNIYSYNIPKNLSPRTIVGAGFVWNIFDGLNREKSMQIAKKESEILELSGNQLLEDLHLLCDKLYYQLNDAKNNLATINTTIELARELVKIREKSLDEGMATTVDVINAHATLAKTKIAAAMAYFQYDLSLATLLTIAGTGYEFTDYQANADIIL